MSAPIAGNYDCAALLETKARVNEIFADDVRSVEYQAETTAADMVLENQTARLEILKDPEKDREVKVYWVDDCDDTDPTEECPDICTIGGDEIGTSCVNYSLTDCIYKEWSVGTLQFRTSNLSNQEVLAVAMAKKLKLMDELLAKKVIAHFDMNAGVNLWSTGSPYTVSGDTTYIPAAAWGTGLMGWIYTMMRKNKIPNGKILTGTAMSQLMWNVQNGAGDLNAADRKKLGAMGNIYVDLFHLEDVTAAGTTFIVNPNAVALVTKNYNPAPGSTPAESFPEGGGKIFRTSIVSPSYGPRVIYDLDQMKICENGDDKLKFRLSAKVGTFQNPAGCNTDRTGIIKLVCGTAPSE